MVSKRLLLCLYLFKMTNIITCYYSLFFWSYMVMLFGITYLCYRSFLSVNLSPYSLIILVTNKEDNSREIYYNCDFRKASVFSSCYF